MYSLYGVYTGYYLYVYPIFRPGLLLGTALKKDEIYKSIDGINYKLEKYDTYKIDYYAGLTIQSGILTFLLSNFGIGGGINIQF